MLRWIIGSSLRLRTVVVAFAAILLAGGVWRMAHTPVEVVPEFSPLTLQVQTEALGLSASEVESLITVPLEADLLNGVPWLKSIESESITGRSSIEMFFALGTDLMNARQMVQERLTQAHALPNVSSPPTLLQPVSSASRIMNIGLTSKTVSMIEMSVQARWTIVPRLVGVPGVANVSVWGMRNRQVQVQVDPERLRAKGVTLDRVVKTAGEAVWASPLTYLNSSTPGAGGFIDTPNQRLGVRHVSPTSSPETFSKVPVHGTRIALNEVATVVEDSQPLIGDAVMRDGPGLMLVIEKFPGANTQAVTAGVEAALRELSQGMKGIEVDTSIYRTASFIERASKNLANAFALGMLAMVIALVALLANWRAALIAAVSIPTALLAAVWVFHLRGANIDMMVVAGLMLAMAVVIDDIVGGVGNAVKQMTNTPVDGTDRSMAAAVMRATLQTRGPMLYATVIVLLAVLPVLFMEGAAAMFFGPLIWSYILAVVAALVVALTVTPALCMFLLARGSGAAPQVSPLMARLQSGTERLLGRALNAPKLAWSLAAAGVVVGTLTVAISERSYLPTFKETDVVVEWEGAAGTSLPAMTRVTSAVIKDVLAIKGVRNAAAHVGRALLSQDAADVHSAEIWVSIDPEADYRATLQALRETVSGYEGVKAEVNTFMSKQLREVLTGGDDTISVRIYGHDQKIIAGKAVEIRDLMAKVEGVANPSVEVQAEKTTIEVKVDLERARVHGLKPGDVRRAASALVSGITVGSLFQEQKVFEVVVLGTPGIRANLNDVRNLLIDTPTGAQVRLHEVADVMTVASPGVIRRQGVSRRIDVGADIPGGNVGPVSREVARRIKDVAFPFEYHAQVMGEHFERRASLQSLYSYLGAAAVVGFLVLQAAMRSWRLAVLALVGVPIAALGGFIAVLLAGAKFELGSFLGFAAIFGLAVRQGIALVHRFQELEAQGLAFDEALVRRGLNDQFPVIVTSALTTAALMLPFMLMGDVAGLEVTHAMAVVVIGGLVSTVLLMLACVPALYLRYGSQVLGRAQSLDGTPVHALP